MLKDEAQEDILDEVIKYFKPNVLFRNFEVKGTADRVLIYLTIYVHQCLLRIERKKANTRAEADKVLFGLAQESFVAPGDRDFLLGGFFPAPKNNVEKQMWTEYFQAGTRRAGSASVGQGVRNRSHGAQQVLVYCSSPRESSSARPLRTEELC